MEIQASRSKARVDASGAPILLLNQNRALWDQLLIHRGFAALERASQLAPPGPYALQAAIAACHARARTPEETDWSRIAHLYAALAQIKPSPVIELNRAVAVSMASGPAAGLSIVEALAGEPALEKYHLLYSVRGDFLEKLGRLEEPARISLEPPRSLRTLASASCYCSARPLPPDAPGSAYNCCRGSPCVIHLCSPSVSAPLPWHRPGALRLRTLQPKRPIQRRRGAIPICRASGPATI